jgi:hypothetical protein
VNFLTPAATVISTVTTVISFALTAVSRRQAGRARRSAHEELSKHRIEQELRLSEFSRPLEPGESRRLSEYTVVNMRMRMRVDVKVTRPARSRSAIGLTKLAASVLPASDRDRYAEEFRAELQDLAQSGAGHLRQLLYGLRQIRGILQMRYALRSPRRKSATP